MSILGKLLIIFNLLAAGAFAYITLGNWKVRQELTRSGVIREVQLRGVPLEAPASPPKDLGTDRVAFTFIMPGDQHITSIRKDLLSKIVPAGGEKLGGAAGDVANQTEEVKRLQKKVIDSLPAVAEGQDPTPRLVEIRNYLLALARSGADRDGVNALFDQRDAARKDSARRDLALLARTSSQVAAMRTLVDVDDLGEPQMKFTLDAERTTRIAQAREAVKRFLMGEASHGVPPPNDPKNENDQNANKEAIRTLTNAIDAAMRDRAGEAEKASLKAAATADAAGWEHLANLAVEPLADKPSCDRAMAALLAYAQGKGATENEKAALAGIKDLISPPPLGFDPNKSLDTVGVALLNAHFDFASMPASTGKQGPGPNAGEKARRIAHLLYHIDGWRHADATQTVVDDRKAWHSRVAAVVGLPEYIRAAEAQASEYAEAAQRLIAAITEEQSAFEAEYGAQVQKVNGLYAQWLVLDNQFKAQEAITNENIRLKDERLTERNNLIEALKVATEDAKNVLARLQATQARLFSIQRDLRNAQAAILEMEKELRRIELGK